MPAESAFVPIFFDVPFRRHLDRAALRGEAMAANFGRDLPAALIERAVAIMFGILVIGALR